MNRFSCYSGICLLFVLVLTGCSTVQTSEPIPEGEILNRSDTRLINENSQEPEMITLLDRLELMKKVSVVTPEGFEMELNPSVLREKIWNNIKSFKEIEPVPDTYSITLILRPEVGNPMVMQIGSQSITLADHTFTSEHLPQLLLDIRGAIGSQLLADLSMEQMSVFMLDVANHPLDFANEEIAELRKIIESATLIHENTEVTYPLFPHYVIQILDGDKSVVHLDIIGNNIISIPYGKDQKFYYHVSENLYTRFYRILPPFDFLEDHPKSLFSATALEVIPKNGDILQFGTANEGTMIDDSITDSFARLLVDGNKQMAYEGEQEHLYTLRFYTLSQPREVKVFSDGYIYKDTYYQLQQIGEKIQKHIHLLKKE